jgi:uncharacterized protein YbaR (Trm112 family)
VPVSTRLIVPLTAPLAAHLVDGLACPRCKQPILYFPRGEADTSEEEGFLLCPGSRLKFAIREGIANLIADEAIEVTPEEAERLVARARALGRLP